MADSQAIGYLRTMPKSNLPPRIAAIDAYRGFVMFLMLAEVLHLSEFAKKVDASPVLRFLGYHQTHVEWRGCSLHDLIQPSFSFLVGTSLAISLAKRLANSTPIWRVFAHAFWRSGMLILLGVFLRSVGRKQTYWTFEDTLTQIGLGYVPLVAIAFLKPRWQVVTVLAIVIGYFALFAVYPAPGPDYFLGDRIPGAPEKWPHHPMGFASHWDKNSNAAWKFDTWFLNLFPREKPFEYHSGGYATLSFVPTLGTMVLGLLAGQMLMGGVSTPTLRNLIMIGVVLLLGGWLVDWLGVCPNVKRIWTPSWVLFSGGWCYLLLALFSIFTDLIGRSEWAYPLRAIGANSIMAYVGSHLVESFVIQSLKTHLGRMPFQIFGEPYEKITIGAIVLLGYVLVLIGMERRKIFIRI